jgi:hypothetical protein
MNRTVAYKTAVCAQSEILLKETEGAFEAWDERREQIATLVPTMRLSLARAISERSRYVCWFAKHSIRPDQPN